MTPMLAAFLGASLVLAVTPGPAVVYIVTRTLASGRNAGLASVAGVALGNFTNALVASVGLAALLAVSAAAYSAVKLAGAFYLVYLGVQMLRRSEIAAAAPRLEVRADLRRVFRDGVVVALLNPKTALFFAAFLPQFIDPAAPALPQSVLLGALFVSIAACTDSVYVLAAGLLAPRLARLRRGNVLGRYAAATAFIGMGAYAAMSGSRAPR